MEERETGVITDEREALVEEVDAMSRKVSLSLKVLMKKNLKKKLISYHFVERKIIMALIR